MLIESWRTATKSALRAVGEFSMCSCGKAGEEFDGAGDEGTDAESSRQLQGQQQPEDVEPLDACNWAVRDRIAVSYQGPIRDLNAEPGKWQAQVCRGVVQAAERQGWNARAGREEESGRYESCSLHRPARCFVRRLQRVA